MLLIFAFTLISVSLLAGSVVIVRQGIISHNKRKYQNMLKHTAQLEQELGLADPPPQRVIDKIESNFYHEGHGGYAPTWSFPVSAVGYGGITMSSYYDPMWQEETRRTNIFQIKNNRLYVKCPWCNRWVYSKIVMRGGNINAKNLGLTCQYCRKDIKADVTYEHTAVSSQDQFSDKDK